MVSLRLRMATHAESMAGRSAGQQAAAPSPDERLVHLPLPLRSVGVEQRFHPADLMGEGRVFGPGVSRSTRFGVDPCVECALIPLGAITLLSGRTTPVSASETAASDAAPTSSLTFCVQGAPSYSEGAFRLALQPGDTLLLPRNGGTIHTGYLASLNLGVDHQALGRTLRVMLGDEPRIDLSQPLRLPGSGWVEGEGLAAPLRHFFSYLDGLLRGGRHLGPALGLDEQLLRVIALALLHCHGLSETLNRRWQASRHGSASLDELVEYIRANAHLPLTLTDLEERSHYSARHLQSLFRRRFDCTPMAFVRRQRLGTAMERLQAAADGDSVSRIARDCGYRHLPNFSTDFLRAFGTSPSAVLRASRQRAPKQEQRRGGVTHGHLAHGHGRCATLAPAPSTRGAHGRIRPRPGSAESPTPWPGPRRSGVHPCGQQRILAFLFPEAAAARPDGGVPVSGGRIQTRRSSRGPRWRPGRWPVHHPGLDLAPLARAGGLLRRRPRDRRASAAPARRRGSGRIPELRGAAVPGPVA